MAGVDEVGRGCLAGPVMAAAVVLDPARHIAGLCDSKQVPPAERERLAELIKVRSAGWAIGVAGVDEIDRLNIHRASLEAMRRAVLALDPLPDVVLVDAFRVPSLWMPQCGVPHGDVRCAAIAAASIVAKVVRDRHMVALHAADPRYGFDRHKGYNTDEHERALTEHGPCPAHRYSFVNVNRVAVQGGPVPVEPVDSPDAMGLLGPVDDLAASLAGTSGRTRGE